MHFFLTWFNQATNGSQILETTGEKSAVHSKCQLNVQQALKMTNMSDIDSITGETLNFYLKFHLENGTLVPLDASNDGDGKDSFSHDSYATDVELISAMEFTFRWSIKSKWDVSNRPEWDGLPGQWEHGRRDSIQRPRLFFQSVRRERSIGQFLRDNVPQLDLTFLPSLLSQLNLNECV